MSSHESAPQTTAARAMTRMSPRACFLVRSTRGSGRSAKWWARDRGSDGTAGSSRMGSRAVWPDGPAAYPPSRSDVKMREPWGGLFRKLVAELLAPAPELEGQVNEP